MAPIATAAQQGPPPTSALPQVPVSKIRCTSTTSESSRIPSTSSSTPRQALRTPSKIVKPPPLRAGHAASSPDVPTLASTAKTDDGNLEEGDGDSQVRRSVSIANFPQPPKVRRSGAEPRFPADSESMQSTRAVTSRARSLEVKKLKNKAATGSLNQMYSASHTPSLLNHSGDGKSVSGSAMRRESSGLASVQSAGHSRSSSAQDSQSTSATTFEDSDEKRQSEGRSRGRDSGSKDKESKGNVIVGVRVRPDAGGDKSSGRDWSVDARRSLVAYRGREGGDYYYGKLATSYELQAHALVLLHPFRGADTLLVLASLKGGC